MLEQSVVVFIPHKNTPKTTQNQYKNTEKEEKTGNLRVTKVFLVNQKHFKVQKV